jgi:hypothetical protein
MELLKWHCSSRLDHVFYPYLFVMLLLIPAIHFYSGKIIIFSQGLNLTHMETTSQRDERLWKIAKARASFKSQLLYFMILIAFFWAIWLATGQYERGGTPWPVWPSLGLGVVLAFQYFNAWHRDPFGDTLREYEKLQEEKQRRGI